MPIRFTSSKEVQIKLRTVTQKYPQVIDSFLKESADRIQSTAKQTAPVKTGFLRSNIVVKKISNGYNVRAEADYSEFQEYKRQFMKRAIDNEMPNLRDAPKEVKRMLGL